MKKLIFGVIIIFSFSLWLLNNFKIKLTAMKKGVAIFAIIWSFQSNTFSQTYFDLTKDFPCNGCANYNAEFKTMNHYSASQIKTVFDSTKR